MVNPPPRPRSTHQRRLQISGGLAIVALLSLAWVAMAQTVVQRGRFEARGFPVDGGVHVEQTGDRLVVVLEADFVTKAGPDLELFLSPRSLRELDNRDATRGAVRIGRLQKSRGAQRYPLPPGTDSRRFRCLVLHSETFSKLWGGAELR